MFHQAVKKSSVPMKTQQTEVKRTLQKEDKNHTKIQQKENRNPLKNQVKKPVKTQQKEDKKPKIVKKIEEDSRQSVDDFVLMMNLRKKILVFRDVMDLPPANSSISMSRLIVRTINDLHDQFPHIVSRIRSSELQGASIDQVLPYFSKALKSIGDSWMIDQDGTDIFNCDIDDSNKPEHFGTQINQSKPM